MAIYVDDKELIAAHQAGDTEAFEEIVASIVRLCLLMVDESSTAKQPPKTQFETLARAYRALPKFDGEYRLGPWLHRIMANVCSDEAKRRIRDGEKLTKFASDPSARFDVPSVEDELGFHFDEGPLDAALQSLPDPHREALVLRFVDELEYPEMASVAGVSEQNLRERVSPREICDASCNEGCILIAGSSVGPDEAGRESCGRRGFNWCGRSNHRFFGDERHDSNSTFGA